MLIFMQKLFLLFSFLHLTFYMLMSLKNCIFPGPSLAVPGRQDL